MSNAGSPGLAGGGRSRRNRFEIFVLYEDYGTALRAKVSLDALPAGIRNGPGTQMHLWKLDLLQYPFLCQVAAAEAAAAAVVLVSLHGHAALPGPAAEWLKLWRTHGGGECAFGLLLDAEPESRSRTNAVRAVVEEAAQAAGAHFIFGCCPVPLEVSPPTSTGHSMPVLPGSGRRLKQPPRWGINE